MRTILALSLIAAAVSFVPAASAECVQTTCVNADSFGSGSCDSTGYAYNYASAYTYGTPAGTVSGGASTSCSSYSSFNYEYTSLGGGAYTYGPAGYHYVYVGWYGYTYGSFSACNSYVYGTDGVGYNQLGCPAGAPPAVPGLLP